MNQYIKAILIKNALDKSRGKFGDSLWQFDNQDGEVMVSIGNRTGYVHSFTKQHEDFLATEIGNAVEKAVEEMRVKVAQIEVRSEQRYLSESGFWSKRELIDKKDVLSALTQTKGEDK